MRQPSSEYGHASLTMSIPENLAPAKRGGSFEIYAEQRKRGGLDGRDSRARDILARGSEARWNARVLTTERRGESAAPCGSCSGTRIPAQLRATLAVRRRAVLGDDCREVRKRMTPSRMSCHSEWHLRASQAFRDQGWGHRRGVRECLNREAESRRAANMTFEWHGGMICDRVVPG